MFADLHVHSQYSDGRLTPAEIAEKARGLDVSLLSVCDHNTVDAYLCEGDFCAGMGITLIPGVEIHSALDGREYHILAYDIDVENAALADLLRHNRGVLADFGVEFIKNISKDFSEISLEEYLRYERDRRNGGWDSVDYLISKGLAKNWHEHLSLAREYAPAVRGDFFHPRDVIRVIHDAGGCAVLAHLGDTLKQDAAKCGEVAAEFIGFGADGFECYYPSHSGEVTEILLGLGKIVTAGSDDHGGFNNAPGGCWYDMAAIRTPSSAVSELR